MKPVSARFVLTLAAVTALAEVGMFVAFCALLAGGGPR